ncbi:hypothetical protein C1I72_02095 [Ehrlichia canis]|nr:hypothetical protein C1I72_02095 [Ehrlichia canis]
MLNIKTTKLFYYNKRNTTYILPINFNFIPTTYQLTIANLYVKFNLNTILKKSIKYLVPQEKFNYHAKLLISVITKVQQFTHYS